MNTIKIQLWFIASAITILMAGCINMPDKPVFQKTIEVDATKKMQPIDGFGANFTPAQWDKGGMKRTIDLLTDDLGATLFRFDCVGLANWLDTNRMDKQGTYPSSYLDSVYTSKTFRLAWNAFRYFNSKGIEPFFNVSGRINPLLGRPDNPQHLANFDAYAEMVVTMLKWARDKENLKFTILAPFNETSLGYPEGPKIDPEEIVPAIRAVQKKMKKYNMSDIQLIAPDDHIPLPGKIHAMLGDTSLIRENIIYGTHSYGYEPGDNDWESEPSTDIVFANLIRGKLGEKTRIWMTEYGDLDQSMLIENEFAMRSAFRVLKILKTGYNGAMVWDAFDNFHEHDTTWATYGLLKTDTISWDYIARERYYAAKQIFRFVKPGFIQISAIPVDISAKYDVYKKYHNPMQHVHLLAFVSPDFKDLTIVGMNKIEGNISLDFKLSGLNKLAGQKLYLYQTDQDLNCKKTGEYNLENNLLKVTVKKNSIFTVSTINTGD